MALPSQSARPVSPRSPMEIARKKLAPILVGLAGIALVLLASWLLWGRSPNPTGPQSALAGATSHVNTTPAPGPAVNISGPVAPTPANQNSQPSPAADSLTSLPPAAQPVIEMGRSTPAPAPAQTPLVAPPSQPAVIITSTSASPADQAVAAASPSTPAPVESTAPRSSSRLQAGLDLIARNQPLEAREALSAALASTDLSDADADRIRLELAKLNERLVFGSDIDPADPFVSAYTIKGGDALARLPKSQNLQIDWRLLQRINRIPSPEKIQVGQKIKLVTGPFHAVVSKSDFRMDIYEGNGSQKIFIKCFPVGLGEFNSTPVGVFMVRTGKMVNPDWRNPRTGEKFAAADPKNPLGERWIPLQGVSESLKDVQGYGIHGTIEPDTIGAQASMGCVRMLPADVELVYELLTENVSTVEIRE